MRTGSVWVIGRPVGSEPSDPLSEIKITTFYKGETEDAPVRVDNVFHGAFIADVDQDIVIASALLSGITGRWKRDNHPAYVRYGPFIFDVRLNQLHATRNYFAFVSEDGTQQFTRCDECQERRYVLRSTFRMWCDGMLRA